MSSWSLNGGEGDISAAKAEFISKAVMDGLMLAAARKAVPFNRNGFFRSL
jgi:hypothetical protein